MNKNQRRYTDAAWAWMDTLSGMRKRVQREWDFFRAAFPDLSDQPFENASLAIDQITEEISGFITKLSDMGRDEMEMEFEKLSKDFDSLCKRINYLIG